MYEEKIPIIKMEEEEDTGEREPIGFRTPFQKNRPEGAYTTEAKESASGNPLLMELLNERKSILESSSLKPREKFRLLESNRKAFVLIKGGTIKKTENIVYAVLVFSGVLIVTLALLNTFSNLSTEITLTFMGTVLGGTIATITQKIGKL